MEKCVPLPVGTHRSLLRHPNYHHRNEASRCRDLPVLPRGGDTRVKYASAVKVSSWAVMGKSTLADEQRDVFV